MDCKPDRTRTIPISFREHLISWYFSLGERTPHDHGEFKGQVLNTFFALAETDREHVFKTLRTVRIHIVDPRPYTVGLDDALRTVLPKSTTVPDFLRRLDASTKHLEHWRAIGARRAAVNGKIATLPIWWWIVY